MSSRPASRICLHLDADASARALQRVLVSRDHDVTRTPNDWMPRSASDEAQWLGATAQGCCIFTLNIRDFMALARRYEPHAGIVPAFQSRWRLAGLIEALDRLLSETQAEYWMGQVRWLNDWAKPEERSGIGGRS